MKFHQLARQSQFVASQAPARDLSSPLAKATSFIQQQQQQQHLLNLKQLSNSQNPSATSNTSSSSNNIIISDEEDLEQDELDEDFQEPQGFYNMIEPAQRQSTSGAGNQATGQQQDGAFLMDKNKKLFPQKLWELIHNPSIQHCLRWSQDGQRVYLNRNEFEAYYLKTPNNQFHTQKAISFVRQMNMYGFRKVDDCYYENDNFRRDKQHLLRNMIRRHPNKGLFVGLDHHQLVAAQAAAAAQQALQVNQQQQHQQQQQQHQHLLQFDQHQKHRTEQALRLNNYLNNNHHQFHLNQANHHQHHHNQLAHHLNQHSFTDHMSSQLAQVAAHHLSQQQQLLASSQQRHQEQQQQPFNTINLNSASNGNNNNNNNTLPAHQPKKSRLLNNFYANQLQQQQQQNNSASDHLNHQDSMHSTSSIDTQPSSQCSSASGQSPNSPTNLVTNSRTRSAQNQPASIRAAVLAAAAAANSSDQKELNKFNQQQMATDLSQQTVNQHHQLQLSRHQQQEALHQTLVRSLMQLKQHQQQQHSNHDLLASLQQHSHSRKLLESLASLSSTGTGSIVDPTSDSPTERTATPPSPLIVRASMDEAYLDGSSSINHRAHGRDHVVALDLASKSMEMLKRKRNGDIKAEMEQEETEVEDNNVGGDFDVDEDNSPLDGAKKVIRFLDNQMEIKINSKYSDEEQERKRAKLFSNGEQAKNEDRSKSISSISKSLIMEICEQRGDRLEISALNEAAKYLECFLNILLDDAKLIAKKSKSLETYEEQTVKVDNEEAADLGKDCLGQLKQDGVAEKSEDCEKTNCREINDEREKTKRVVELSSGIVDTSSLSLALKSIPSKLIAVMQDQQVFNLTAA